MIFILPSIYYNFEDNINILDMYSNTVKIKGIEGNFPSNIMCGGINALDTRYFALYDDIVGCVNSYSIPSKMLFVDCGNLFLNEKEYPNSRPRREYFCSPGPRRGAAGGAKRSLRLLH